MRNQGALREELAAAKGREAALAAKAQDMEEQLRDMTFHFESQLKILQADAEGGGGNASELSGGSVSAPHPETPASLRSKRKAKARGS